MKSVLGASRALEELVKIMPQDAHLLKDHETTTVKVEDLRAGDASRSNPGRRYPLTAWWSKDRAA
jgi:Cu2+-exporting ATPase